MDIRKLIRRELLALQEDFRYSYDNSHVPTDDVANTARRALQAVESNKQVSQGSNEGSGLQKARELTAKTPMSHAQVKRMKAFFDNNQQAVNVDKSAGKNLTNSAIIQSWELWGGDAGKRWAEQRLNTIHNNNAQSKDVRRGDGIGLTKNLMNPHNTRLHKENAEIGPNGDISISGDSDTPTGVELDEYLIDLINRYKQGESWSRIHDGRNFTYTLPFEAKDELDILGVPNKVRPMENNPEEYEVVFNHSWSPMRPKSFKPREVDEYLDSYLEQHDMNRQSGRIIGNGAFEYWIPSSLATKTQLQLLNIPFEEEMAANRDHPDYGKAFLVFTHKWSSQPKQIDFSEQLKKSVIKRYRENSMSDPNNNFKKELRNLRYVIDSVEDGQIEFTNATGFLKVSVEVTNTEIIFNVFRRNHLGEWNLVDDTNKLSFDKGETIDQLTSIYITNLLEFLDTLDDKDRE